MKKANCRTILQTSPLSFREYTPKKLCLSTYVCGYMHRSGNIQTRQITVLISGKKGRIGGMGGGQNERELLLFIFILFSHIVGSLYMENRFIHHFVIMDM